MKERKQRLVLTKINHLKEQLPWTMGLAGLARLVTWETKNVLGVSKSEFVEKIIDWVLQFQNESTDEHDRTSKSRLKEFCKNQAKSEIEKSEVKEIYQKKITRDSEKNKLLISPMEAQRRIRCFSEEFLNKEFDVFMSLLPNQAINDYLKSFCSRVHPNSKWTLFGLSNDFETATSIKYMYHDTLLYSHSTSHLVAVELKFDTDLSRNQILKYAFMMADLENQGKVVTDCAHDLLIISQELKVKQKLLSKTNEELRDMALTQIDDPERKHYPKKPKGREMQEKIDRLVPRTTEILKQMKIALTDWQELGEYFESLLGGMPKTEHTETYEKLLRGFLASLQVKYSQQNQSCLYEPNLR